MEGEKVDHHLHAQPPLSDFGSRVAAFSSFVVRDMRCNNQEQFDLWKLPSSPTAAKQLKLKRQNDACLKEA